MRPPSIHLIEKLSTKDIEKLTDLLRLSPGKLPSQDWLDDQAARVPDLPARLLGPSSGILSFGMSLNTGPDRAVLCKSHKKLNPYLIRRIFLQISAECTTRLARLLQNPYLSTDVEYHVKRLQILNSLWMSVDLFRVTFQAMPRDPRFFRVPGDCEACILATVGGNPHALCDLRSSMLGRKKKRGKEPRMLNLVEAWIQCTGFGHQLTENSDALAREVRACRRDMQLARRQTRRNQEEAIPDESPLLFPSRATSDASTLVAEDGSKDIFEMADILLDEDDGVDCVEDIINHYADSIRSSTLLLRRAARDDDIHPAYRRSTIPPRSRPSNTPRPSTPRPSTPRPSTPRPSTPSMSTSYASITTIRPRSSFERLVDPFDDFPPRPERPRNRSTYMDSMASARMSRASAVVPPLRPRQHPRPAYTESEYSRDDFGRRAADARSFGTGGATVNNDRVDVEEQARADLMRRQEEESVMEKDQRDWFVNDEEDVEVPPIPRRSEFRATVWSDFAGHRAPLRRPPQDGW